MHAKRALLVAAVVLLATSRPAAAVVADSSDDVCTGDPCTVSEEIEVVDGSTLDFGDRAVIVESSGRFEFGNGSATILCGSFQSEGSKSIVSAGRIEEFSGEKARIVIRAQRQCSGASPLGCIDLDDCGTGTCSVRRCAGKSTQTCTTDSECDLGPCSFSACVGDAGQFCQTNADCSFGPCPAGLACSNRPDDPVACTEDGDCDLGTCTLGSEASITMDGGIRAGADIPGSIVLEAADSISVSGKVDVAGKTPESDGGAFSLYAATGDVTLSSRIRMQGGAYGRGGNLAIESGRDVSITKGISLDGGLFDGGRLDLLAARDTSITGSLSSNGKAFFGSGGQLVIDTGRDLRLGAGRGVRIQLSGSGAEGDGGSGGYIELVAGGNVIVAPKVRVVSNGGAPNGSGGGVGIDAAGDVVFDGEINASVPGHDGRAGSLFSSSGGTTTFGSSSKITFTGANNAGGLNVESTGNLVFAGSARLTSPTGYTGDIELRSSADATITGSIRTTGYRGSLPLVLEACRIELTETAVVDNDAFEARSRLRARESMRLVAGSSLTSDPMDGTNTLEYRTPAKPPILAGTVSPAPILVLNEALPGCPVCGNSEIDQGETCDDGNEDAGDGCDASCQTE
jgi:cysteine-rich repeat protein